MQRVEGAGCWPGRAEGRVVWLSGELPVAEGQVAERAAEVLRFRAALGQALEDLERWSDRQPTLGGRVLLQTYREALMEDAWSHRACALVDGDGANGATAALEAAVAVSAVLERTAALQGRSDALRTAARWFAGRLCGRFASLPQDAVVAANGLSPVELLDLGRPAITGGDEPPVVGESPLVWGVPGLDATWEGRRVAMDGARLTLDLPDPTWWVLNGDRLKGAPLCVLNGNPEALERMARKLGEAPAAVVGRLDDLAAVPLFLHRVVAVALDLDRLGPAPKLKHPGVQLLLRRAAESAAQAGVPLLAGGEAAEKDPDHWLSLGFTALYTRSPARGGGHRALRRHAQGGL